MTKAPILLELSKGQSDNTNNATKNFDYALANLRVPWEGDDPPSQDCGGHSARRPFLQTFVL